MEDQQIELIKKQEGEGKLIQLDNGQKLMCPESVLQKSQVLKQMLEMCDNDEPDDIIPLPEMDERTVKYIIEYCEYYKNREDPEEISEPLIRNVIEEIVDEFDAEFINRVAGKEGAKHNTIDHLFDLLNAANFLDIKHLLSLTACKINCLWMDKEPEEIRELFGIENDFTEEEYKQVCEENKWAEEATK